MTSTQLSEFYQQLSLLTRAKLPLPQSLSKLAKELESSAFSRQVSLLGEETAKGSSFSEALSRQPAQFPPFHRQLLNMAEESGHLPQMLQEVARYAQFEQSMLRVAQEAMLYPLVILNFSLLAFFAASLKIFPAYSKLVEMMMGESMYQLPLSTSLCFWLGSVVRSGWPVFASLQAAFLGGSVWLLCGAARSREALIRIFSILPGTGRILHQLDTARICRLWSLLMEKGYTTDASLGVVQEVVLAPRIQRALERVRRTTQKGIPLARALQNEPVLSPMLAMTVEHATEEDLPDELHELSHMFEERASHMSGSVASAWMAVSIVLAALITFLIVSAVFTPLISLMKAIGGCM